jgi:hypothetical protein
MVGASTTLEYSAKLANGDPLPSFFEIQADQPIVYFDPSTKPKKGLYSLTLVGKSLENGF